MVRERAEKPAAEARLKANDPPQWERMACLKTGIPVVKEVKLTVVASARERFIFSESQRLEGAKVLSDFGLNEDSVLAALLFNTNDFCGDGGN